MKETLALSLDDVDLTDAEKEKARLAPGCAGLVRAMAKEFGTGDDVYAKGEDNKAFSPCTRRSSSSASSARRRARASTSSRARHGGMYYNRPVLAEFISTQARALALARARADFSVF